MLNVVSGIRIQPEFSVTSSSNKCIDFASFHDFFLLDDINFFNNVVFLSQFSILKKVNLN
jgi:hypothetical protein